MSTARIDQETHETLSVINNAPPAAKQGSGRSLRPGKNALRRMTLGRLVREYRIERVERERNNRPQRQWGSLAWELDRRGLKESADYVRRNEEPHRDHRTGTSSIMAGAVAGIVGMSVAQRIGEDREFDLIERSVDQRLESQDLGASELLVETERETSVLSSEEYRQDLAEVSVDDEVLEANDLAIDAVGEDAEAGMMPLETEDESALVAAQENEQVAESEDVAEL